MVKSKFYNLDTDTNLGGEESSDLYVASEKAVKAYVDAHAHAADNKSITENSLNQLQTVGVIDSNDSTKAIKTWTGTKEAYNGFFDLAWNGPIENSGLTRYGEGGLAYNGTKFVYLYGSGYLSTSTNGTTWAEPTYVDNLGLGDDTWYGLASNGTRFVALSGDGYTSTSTDGTTWTECTIDSNMGSHSWYGLVSDGTKFVALGRPGYISTTTDGINWSVSIQDTNLANGDWHFLTYGNGKFVALSFYNYISTSTDGITWTTPVQISNFGNKDYTCLAYDGYKFVAINKSGEVSTSINGITWTVPAAVPNFGQNNYGGALCYDGTKLVAILNSGIFTCLVTGSLDNNTLYNIIEDGLYLGVDKVADISSAPSYTAGTGIVIDANNEISVTSPTLTNTATGNNSVIVGELWGGSYSYNNVIAIAPGTNGSSSFSEANNTVSIGFGAQAGYDGDGAGATAIGSQANAWGENSVALGATAHATGDYSIQIGYGTNSEDNSFYVGTSSSNNYKMLGSDGKIPNARLSAFTGSNGTNAGTIGAVPAPTASDNTKFLKGDGTWATPANSNYVTTNTVQDITAEKTFVGSKLVKFKQSSNTDKLGFTLYASGGTEKGYLEYNPTNTIDGAPLMTIGNYATAAAGITHIGFRKYSNISGANGAYNLLTPLISKAKTPFSLTTTYTNFYLPLGFKNGSTMVTTADTGVADLSTLMPTVNDSTITITQGGVTKGSFTLNQSNGGTIALDAGGGSSYTAGTGIDITNNVISTDGVQMTSNLVTSVSSSSTNSQYPSAKLFYDTCGDIEALINAL